MNNKMKRKILVGAIGVTIMLLFILPRAFSTDYRSNRTMLLKIYKDNIKDPRYLYSNVNIHTKSHKLFKTGGKRKVRVSMEHIVPASRIVKHHGCVGLDRNECSKSNAKASICIGNPYNLAPALLRVNVSRSNKEFTDRNIQGTSPFTFPMVFTTTYVNPPVTARGRIARSYLYMHSIDCIELSRKEITMYSRWHCNHRKTRQEQNIDNLIHFSYKKTRKPISIDD